MFNWIFRVIPLPVLNLHSFFFVYMTLFNVKIAGAAVFSSEGKGKPFSVINDFGRRQIMGNYLLAHLLSCESHLSSDHMSFQHPSFNEKVIIHTLVWLSNIHTFFWIISSGSFKAISTWVLIWPLWYWTNEKQMLLFPQQN